MSKGIGEADLLVHEETNKLQAQLLVAMEGPDFPVALGVIYCDGASETYEERVHAEIKAAQAERRADLRDLLTEGLTWENT